MCVRGPQNTHPSTPYRRPEIPLSGVVEHASTFTLIGDNGSDMLCPPDCACQQALAERSGPPLLTREQLLAWLPAFHPQPSGAAAHNRMAHHERRTNPDSPLNEGWIRLARELAAFGVTPEHYALLHKAGLERQRPFCPLRWREGSPAGTALLAGREEPDAPDPEQPTT